MRYVLLLGSFIVLLVQTVVTEGDENYRLPNNTYPLRYNLELTTSIHNDSIGSDRFKFEGKVTVQLMTEDQIVTNNITLNYRRIEIKHVKLWYEQGGAEHIILNDNSSFTLDEQREFLTIHSPLPLEGMYYLEIHYNGTLREDNAGFYRSSYTDDSGVIRWLAATQFSSTDARHAFPCYDEPGIRAPIALRVIHGTDYSVLSNGLSINQQQHTSEGMTITTFEDTPRMQSYLLAVIVSDFQGTVLPAYSRHSAFSRPISISTNSSDFILEASYKTLNFLEQFLETDYILPKMYHVAIPDFSAGAMENYGLITYKEENFFYTSGMSPMKQLKSIATVVGHEIGHHYFGNYVSPAWWSYLWMKEGFARFCEYHASHHVYPELEIGQTYTVDKTHNAFDMDSLNSVRPMTQYVNTQFEIASIFDDIAYDKGGAVLRMFSHAFGEEVFRKALVNYLQANALQAAHPIQFAEAIQKALDELSTSSNDLPNADDLLKSWTEQAGFPVLHVSRTSNCTIVMSQKRYLLKDSNSLNNATWILPYSFTSAVDPSFESTIPDGWLTTTTNEIFPSKEQNWSCNDWIVFNKQQTGYYRINYDDDLWHMITKVLHESHTIIHNMNRAQLIDDALNNARSGRLSYEIPLQLLPYLSEELNYVPWAALDRNMRLLNTLLSTSEAVSLWHRYCLEFIEPIYNRIGITTRPEDSLFQRMTRGIVVSWACKAGSPHCLNNMASMLTAMVENATTDADPDMRETIICNGLRNASDYAFDVIWERMQASKDHAYRSELIRALSCSQNEAALLRFLHTTIETNSTNYFTHERERVLTAVFSSGLVGMDIAITFFETNMDEINYLYNKGNFGGRAISQAVRRMAKLIVNENTFIRLQTLMEQLLKAEYLRDADVSQCLELSTDNLEWIQTKGMEIQRWLEERFYG
ncbi:aminopeptidase N-like [Anopheles bellator]|uniref:aminopeptidase N-like n=1 Tax=Anopheles bellator TaxID=139047 RepID=UPI002648608F|nr:aminopeptidase N-like [Anopheles bellator]